MTSTKDADFTGRTILIVDDIPTNLKILVDFLEVHGFKIVISQDGQSAVKRAEFVIPDLILLDVIMPGKDGFEVCRLLKENSKTMNIPVIFMTALSETVNKIKGFESGAVDYITKPFQLEETLIRIRTHLMIRDLQKQLEAVNKTLEQKVMKRTSELEESNSNLQMEILEHEKTENELKEALDKLEQLKNNLTEENIYLQEEIKLTHNFEEIIGKNQNFLKVLGQIEQVAASETTVLILGETGTGKELLARAIHNLSDRKHRPLVKVSCAALPPNLIENELFGHEKGAFTGALSLKIGRFELADKGTIFLDEIGDLPLDLQTKLLRVLQESEFERLGGSKTIKVNVRVVAATNRDIEKQCATGEFRKDLFYRLNVFPLEAPSLKDRKDDIPMLVSSFVEKYNKKIGKRIEKIPKSVIRSMQNYHWPGNVRELEGLIERAVILSPGNTLVLGDWLSQNIGMQDKSALPTLDQLQKEHIIQVLDITQGKISGENGASRILGLNRSTLQSRMKKLGIRINRKTAEI